MVLLWLIYWSNEFDPTKLLQLVIPAHAYLDVGGRTMQEQLPRQESIGLESTVLRIPACAGMTIF